MTSRPTRILGICGSLRPGSFNRALLEACREFLPEGAELEIRTSGELPHYDASLDGENPPAPVAEFRERVAAADALLFGVPEYNYSLPGVLKNAIDWASRPAFRSALAGKPAGIVSATTGPLGGARAQGHLKLVLSSTLSPVFPSVEMLVGEAAKKFDADGRLVEEAARRRLERYVQGFVAWVRLLPRDQM